MYRIALQLTVLLGVTFGLLGCQNSQPVVAEEPAEPIRDGVFVHISHGPSDAHRVLMGLKMATVMAEDKDVLVYFDVEGVQAVLKETDDFTAEAFESVHQQLDGLLENGVPVYVCPTCLKNAGKTISEVRDGVKVAAKEAFFDFTDGRILTLDY
jgi:predicted peroxiredoxin